MVRVSCDFTGGQGDPGGGASGVRDRCVCVCVCVDIHLSVFVDSFHLKCHQWKSRPPLGNNEQTSGGREEMIASMINSSPP